MPDTLPIVKTPFEKSLSQRITHACCILEIVTKSQIYIHKNEMDAIDGLQKTLESYSKLNMKYLKAFETYFMATIERKSLIKGTGKSVKQTAKLINRCINSDLTVEKTLRKHINALYRILYTQNRLNAPYDFRKVSHNKDMYEYFHSNHTILDCFKEMITQLSTYTFIKPKRQFLLPHCYLLISEMEMFNVEISLLVDKLDLLNNERLEIFNRIVARCRAICNRSRVIFGAGSPIYKLIKRHKVSVKLVQQFKIQN